MSGGPDPSQHCSRPWSRAKQIARALRGEDEFPAGYTGSRTIVELNELFDACFRIQAEASEAAERRIPLVVENVVGAQAWVGPARWHHGSYYLWGDVPALMPIVRKAAKVGGLDWSKYGQPDYKTSGAAGCFRDSAIKNTGGSWFRVDHNTTSGKGRNPDGRPIQRNDPRDNPAEHSIKVGGDWFSDPTSPSRYGSKSNKRKAASAMIAKIPFDLAHWIGRAWLPAKAA